MDVFPLISVFFPIFWSECPVVLVIGKSSDPVGISTGVLVASMISGFFECSFAFGVLRFRSMLWPLGFWVPVWSPTAGGLGALGTSVAYGFLDIDMASKVPVTKVVFGRAERTSGVLRMTMASSRAMDSCWSFGLGYGDKLVGTGVVGEAGL